MDWLSGAWGHLMMVLSPEEGKLKGLHNVVLHATRVALVLELTVDIFYLRCGDLKIAVDDTRGMSC